MLSITGLPVSVIPRTVLVNFLAIDDCVEKTVNLLRNGCNLVQIIVGDGVLVEPRLPTLLAALQIEGEVFTCDLSNQEAVANYFIYTVSRKGPESTGSGSKNEDK